MAGARHSRCAGCRTRSSSVRRCASGHMTSVRDTSATKLFSADPAETGPLIAALPSELRLAFLALAASAQGHYRARRTQWVFDRGLRAFDGLRRLGAQHNDIAALLAELGIHDKRGNQLSVGTVSAGLGRARLKADAGRGRSRGHATSEKCFASIQPHLLPPRVEQMRDAASGSKIASVADTRPSAEPWMGGPPRAPPNSANADSTDAATLLNNLRNSHHD